MPAFVSWLGKFVLEFLWGKLVAFLSAVAAKLKRQKQIDDHAEEAAKPLKEAESAEDIDKAIDDALR